MAPDNDTSSQSAAEQDRRGAPRYPAHFNVQVTLGPAAPIVLLATSVSQTGIFFKSDAPPAIGQHVGVFVDLPYATVKLAATVRRVVAAPAPEEERGYAVQIEEIHEGEQAWAGLVRTARMRAPKSQSDAP